MSITYVFELGCEELPSSALPGLHNDLHDALVEQLSQARVSYDAIQMLAAPRRIGAVVSGLSAHSEGQTFEKRGPAVNVAYRDGEPTPALLGFCRGLGISPAQVSTIETDKGAWVVYQGDEPGRPVELVLPEVVQSAVRQLPLSKPMRWGAGRDEFPRPVHWILSLLNTSAVPLTLFGLQSGTQSYGHRFHAPEAVTISHAENYFAAMRDAYVLAAFEDRKMAVWESIVDCAAAYSVSVEQDESLLVEINCLVEWPVALCGEFDAEFLEVPDIALIAAMRGHQKYFHTRSADGSLSHRFITVANIESQDPAQVILGNQRVIRARLSDARFFFTTDKSQSLASRRRRLDHITFHPKLGSLGDKTERVKQLMQEMAPHLGLDPTDAVRTAELSRCDLVSEMVLEFDELQGQMGAIYAALDGERADVGQAVAGLYQPAGASDSVPLDPLGTLLAMADRIDTLAGLFAAKQPPTGSKDPFGLRRAAIGLLRLNEQPAVQIDLGPWLKLAFSHQPCDSDESSFDALLQFVGDRERVRLTDQGLPHDIVNAVQASLSLATVRTERRAQALQAFQSHQGFSDLVSANKRIANILEKAKGPRGAPDASLFRQPEEVALYEGLMRLSPEVGELVSRETFDEALAKLSTLREPIDAFFEHVMVNDEDARIRDNRLALLEEIRRLFLQIADLSLVQG